MRSEDKELIAEFVIESREHLVDIETQLLAIETAGANVDADLVNKVFRAVHSIKGAAGFLGFGTLGNLAHHLENVLNLIRAQKLVPDSAATDILLRAADTLGGMLEDIENSNEVDIDTHVSELQQVVAASQSGAKATKETGAPSPDEAPETATDPTAIREKEAEAGTEMEAPVPAAPSDVDPAPTSETPPSAAEPAANPPASNSEPVMPANHEPEKQGEGERRDVSQPDRRAAEGPGRRTADSAPGTSVPVETNIRVSVHVLDSLMNLAGELVLARNQLLQAVGSTDGTGLDSVSARLDQVTSELQEAIMQTRMQAIGTVFNRFPRVVRDLSANLGKKCQLTLEGEDVELDKSIIEAIADPLTHLVRNAVDHGVELPNERVAAGKPEVGTVVLRAYHQAGKVNISISDNGGGIDAEKLKEKAIARSLLTPEQASDMGEREALRLIFHPGFSMAERVTDVSGRGVGMDVVKTNIEKLGGAVSIDTEAGMGTTINVKLPLTLAIIPSLIVRCRDNRFAIPQASISELVRIKASEAATKIERVKNAEVFRLRGALLPLVRLDDALDLEPAEEREDAAINIIVVEAGHLQYGLVVDGLHDSEEIVVKPLGRHMQNCQCLAGATILGDGRVALILDVAGMASHCELVLPDGDEQKHAGDVTLAAEGETQTVLLFTYNPEEQFGIPMEIIARLERVRASQIDSVGGREVLQYRGESLPILCLDKYITAQPCPDTEKISIVVVNVFNREIGLLVPTIVDIRDISTKMDVTTLRESGVIGSVEVGKKVMRLLDVYELTCVARPDWFAEQADLEIRPPHDRLQEEEAEHIPTILLAEDSDFFRNQVTKFIEDTGCKVVGCEDGLIAWNTLKESTERFDLVVTDIQMPNMDGFEFARRIKSDPETAHLNIVALTSLAGEEDMQRGMEAGIDDYQIKLDRERLINSVVRYVKEAKQRMGIRSQ